MKRSAEMLKIGDLRVNELKMIIRDTLKEVIDPDYGLSLRPEIEGELSQSMKSRKRITAAKIAAEMGLRW
jgi:hypothetical protein